LKHDLQCVQVSAQDQQDRRTKEERLHCAQLLRRIGDMVQRLADLLRVDSSLETKRALEPHIMELVRTGLVPLQNDPLFRQSLSRVCSWLSMHFETFPR
jgi:uncharacterized protein HemX